MDKIFAVILTYNRKDLLRQCLAAVDAQTRRCDGVIVVDNGSSDGTEDMLLGLDMPGLEVHVLSRNIGASGGFSAGFRIAYQRGADMLWIMDDDVIPEPDALDKLLDADRTLAELDQPRAFLLSRAYSETGLLTNVPVVDDRPNRLAYQDWPRLMEHGLVPVRRGTFVSILVPRQTVERYGLPIASMFIWGEDSEFTLRVTQTSPGYLVANSKVLHLRQISGALDIDTEQNPVRLRCHRHLVRNEVFITRQFFRRRRVVRILASQFMVMARLARRRKFAKAWIVFGGILDSLRFQPKPEPADAPVENLGIQVRVAGRPVVARPGLEGDEAVAVPGLQLKPGFSAAQ